jgi:hypothetical protein
MHVGWALMNLLLLAKLKASLRKLYGRHHDLVDRYGISVSQMTTDIKTKAQKDKQRSTKHSYRVTRTSPKTGGELRCSGRVSCSCSTRDTRRVILVTRKDYRYQRNIQRPQSEEE